MAKKKAPRRVARTVAKPVRKAARAASSKARGAIKKIAARATAARKGAKTAMNKAAKAGRSVKKTAAKQVRAAKKQITAAKKQITVAKKNVATAATSATSAMSKATTFAKAVKAGVSAAFTPPTAAPKRHKRPPSLDRERRTVGELHGAPSTLGPKAGATAASSGRDEMKQKLQRITSSSPALTAGDVDADWQSADSSGDEAPGGDNPTPDQDVVDEIGRALGVEYDDDEELQGGDEIADRDRHRWELDPNSREDEDERD